MRTGQSPYEIVADGSDEGGTSKIDGLIRSFYSARGIDFQASAGTAVDEELRRAGKPPCQHRASGFQASKSVSRFTRDIPPTVHVCYKLFWI